MASRRRGSATGSERVGSRDPAQMERAWPKRSLEGVSVDRRQAERDAIARRPLEIVQQRPVEIAVNRIVVLQASPEAVQRRGR